MFEMLGDAALCVRALIKILFEGKDLRTLQRNCVGCDI